MKLTKMVYIASPYSDTDRGVMYYRYRCVTRAIGALQDRYSYAFIGPITQSHHTAEFMTTGCTAFKSWAKRDLTYISHCDAIWVLLLDGWDKSIGVTKEIEFCKQHKIPIKYLEPHSLKFIKLPRKVTT